MAMQYLLVTFPQECAVYADGCGVGTTNRVLMLPAGEYEITLDGGACTPFSQDTVLNGTSLANPLEIKFEIGTPPAKATS